MKEKSIVTPVRIWIRDAAEQLAGAGITTAKLDAEIILAHTIRKSRTWIHAHDDETLTSRQVEIANARLLLRLDRVPVAYIIGHKEFYGRRFNVTPSTLIPRPESETCIELLKELLPADAATLLDVGTGSGCLGITASLELPQLSVTLSDISHYALTVAKDNAARLNADVETVKSNLLDSIPGSFDCIIANLPYVDTAWERSPETDHEPELALFANDDGLALIKELITASKKSLNDNGLLFLEADPCQHEAIVTFAKDNDLRHVRTDDYYVVLAK